MSNDQLVIILIGCLMISFVSSSIVGFILRDSQKDVDLALSELEKDLDISYRELQEEIIRFENGLVDKEDRNLNVMKEALAIKRRYGKR